MKALTALQLFAIALLTACAHPFAEMPLAQRYSANILSTECQAIVPAPHPAGDSLTWKHNNNAPPQKIVCWEHVTTPLGGGDWFLLTERCNSHWVNNACVMARLSNGTCWVLSTLSLAAAKHAGTVTSTSHITGKSPVSVYQHEVDGHCAGWDHDEASVLPLTWNK